MEHRQQPAQPGGTGRWSPVGYCLPRSKNGMVSVRASPVMYGYDMAIGSTSAYDGAGHLRASHLRHPIAAPPLAKLGLICGMLGSVFAALIASRMPNQYISEAVLSRETRRALTRSAEYSSAGLAGMCSEK